MEFIELTVNILFFIDWRLSKCEYNACVHKYITISIILTTNTSDGSSIVAPVMHRP